MVKKRSHQDEKFFNSISGSDDEDINRYKAITNSDDGSIHEESIVNEFSDDFDGENDSNISESERENNNTQVDLFSQDNIDNTILPNESMTLLKQVMTSEVSLPFDTEHPEEPNTYGLLTEVDCVGLSLQEICSTDKFRRRLANDYQKFLTTFTDEQGHSVYHARIRTMCASNGESLEVSYLHLVESNAFLAKLIANQPEKILEIMDESTMRIVLRLFEEYDKIRDRIHVRISDLPTLDHLRELRYTHLGTLIRTMGVVTRRSGVFPQLQLVKYDCEKCRAILGPFVMTQNFDGKDSTLPIECSMCKSKGPFIINMTETIYRNYQKLTLQESPGSVPAGRLPRHREVILLWDLIDAARPGELIEVTGIYKNNFNYALNSKYGFPVFATLIEANHILKKEDQFSEFRLTEDDQKEIKKLAADPLIGLKIIKSIAPSIYGHVDVKTAIALSLFGGQPKNVQGKHQIRGDINILMLGDPGTAKSQFLKYIEQTAQRAVYTTGQGASAVGLTASVRKDSVTREWTLEGGALVLADKGVCLIDEFDKMNDADRTSIHEAMEQQSISISKAGIVTTLQARCAVIAAANPIRGRYNASLPFGENVQLTGPILSRFDVLCVIKDVVDADEDNRLAKFVVGSHIISSLPTGSISNLAMNLQSQSIAANLSIEPLDQKIVKKYIHFAKSRVNPVLNHVDVDRVARLYADLRKESQFAGSIPITVRHVESIVRMSEAHARMHLRDVVRSDDIDLAIRVMLESFIQSQKYSIMMHLRKSFGKYISYKRDIFELLYMLLQEMIRERNSLLGQNDIIKIPINEFELRARELNCFDLRSFYSGRTFLSAGFRITGSNIEKHTT